MAMHFPSAVRISLCAIPFALIVSLASAEPVLVKKREGVVHGFLVLKSLEGEILADGDLVQVPRERGIESRLTFHFGDGSLHDERVFFSQDRSFLLESYQLVQKGPSFPKSLEVTLDRDERRYEIRHFPEDGGKVETLEGELELPRDTYNGMFFILLKNLPAQAAKTEVSMVAFTPEPRVLSLEISSQGEETFSIGKRTSRAVHYALNPEVRGLTGLLAELFGKDPEPLHTWMVRGDAPTFVKFQGFLYQGGPVWSIELASPTWPSGGENR